MGRIQADGRDAGPMKKVLLTGASGFLGRWLVPALLREGHAVVAAARSAEALPEDKAMVVPLDVTDRESFAQLPAGIDTIIHAATLRPNEQAGWVGVAAAIEANILGTLYLLEYAAAHHTQKIVYCSTLAVYGLPQRLPIREDGPTYPIQAPDSHYAISKLAGELLCTRAHVERRVSCLCLRLARIYGPGENPNSLLSRWIREAREGREIVVHGNGERSLDFIYIEDAVRSICLAVRAEGVDGIVNVGSGVEVTWRLLAENVVELFSPAGRRTAIRYISHGDQTRCYLDVEKARAALGFTTRFSIVEGLKTWKSLEDRKISSTAQIG